MPVLFNMVMVEVETAATAMATELLVSTPTDEALHVLWRVFQLVSPGLGNPPPEWTAAMSAVLDMERPPIEVTPTHDEPVEGELSAAYADDASSAGWLPRVVYKTLLRVAAAREVATLEANPEKCAILVPAGLLALGAAIVAPLGWEAVTNMKVLGVMLTDPTDLADGALDPVRDQVTVVRALGAADRGSQGWCR